MGKRRQVRHLVVQFLYQKEIQKEVSYVESLRLFWETAEANDSAKKSANLVIVDIEDKLEPIDEMITGYLRNWEVERLAPIDRNVLRLALYEMHYCMDIPPVVSINEAIEIAKEFSTEDSGRFVNGVLDRAKKDLKRPLREAKKKNESEE